MSASEPTLPAGFEDLAPFVADWALPTNMARYIKRVHSTMPALQAFYNAVEPRAEQAIEWLDRAPIGNINGPDTRLMHLLLMLIDVSLAVEVYKAPTLPLSPAPDRYSVHMERMTFD